MRDQYKVLQEKYTIALKENANAEITSIIKELITLHRPEDKEEFMKLLGNYALFLYQPRIHPEGNKLGPVSWETMDIAEEVLGQKISEKMWKGKLTATDHLYGVLSAYRSLREDPKDWEHLGPNGLQKEFDKEFAEWCDSMKAREELYKDNPGVNIDI